MVLTLLMGLVTHAQTSALDSTQQWVSIKNIDLYTGNILADTFYITLNKTELTLKNGDLEKRFDLTNLSGAWENVNEAGKISFDIVLKDFTGKGKAENENGALSLIIDLSERKNWMYRKFIIHN